MIKWKSLSEGIVKQNPVFRLILGMCPTLAVTTEVKSGLGMGLATTAVLIGSNVVISLVRNLIPSRVRIPVFIVIIASFVTVVDFLLNAYAFALHQQLGLFIPLIVVNCIILGRAEAYASKNTIFNSLLDGLGMGIGFTLSLAMLGAIRELLGTGTLLGIQVFSSSYEPFILMILPPGAFIALGIFIGIMNKIQNVNNSVN